MYKDYRNTKYCPTLSELSKKKNNVIEDILFDHPKAKDMHAYISDNEQKYKTSFMEAYNGKCAYCGVSLEIIPRHMFEIDHFIYEKSARFNGSKANAGYIENLVLSCHNCNRSKLSLEIPDDMHDILHPDYLKITELFFRDEQYYIKISPEICNSSFVMEFYKKLKLGNEIHRIDYLLMNMKGLQKKMQHNSDVYGKLSNAINMLQIKRNVMC